MLGAIGCCFGSSSTKPRNRSASVTATEKIPLFADDHTCPYISEKPAMYRRAKTEVASDIIEALYNIESVSTTNTSTLENIVHQAGWWNEVIADAVLTALKHTLEAGKEMNSVMRRAYDRAVAEAMKLKEFASDHPVLVGALLTVVAIGMLYLFWPQIVAALGFGEDGPVLGSLAARWQSFYPDVPVGSVFAFLQRLGMTVKRAAYARL